MTTYLAWKDYDEAETIRISEVKSTIDFYGTFCEFFGVLLNDPDRFHFDDLHTVSLDHVLMISQNMPCMEDLEEIKKRSAEIAESLKSK